MLTITPTPTHKAVQEHYGKVARDTEGCCGPEQSQTRTAQAGSCCGTSDASQEIQNGLYPLELLSGVPADIANFTAGSGDPITLAALQSGETVLDLGSGGGLDCFLAARQVGESGHVIGVDMTTEMLERARAAAKRLNSRNVEFREGYLESLPVDDSSVDAIISNCVVNLSPDKPRVFREMLRVLKPGGRIALSDVVANHPLDKATGEDKEKWCACTSGALERSTYHEELRRAGFTDIRIEPDLDTVAGAVKSGQVRSEKKVTVEEVLDEIRKWEKSERTMVAPHKITARKPA